MPWICPLGHPIKPVDCIDKVYDREKKKEVWIAVDQWWAHTHNEEAHVMFDEETGEPVDADVLLAWEVD